MPFDEFCILHTVSCTPDMLPIYAKRSELEELFSLAYTQQLALDEFDVDQDTFFGAIKTASILREWMNEISQDRIIERYDIGPGDLHSRVEIADWLLYAFAEVGKILKYPYVREVERLRLRVKYGVKEELLPIVSLKGIGRVRARRLFDSGFDSVDKLRKASLQDLIRIPGIGERLARSILEQIRHG